MTRFAIWPNSYKQPGTQQPDGRGHLEISCTLVQELAAAMAQGQGMVQDAKGEWVFKVSLSAWRSNGQNPQAPILSGVAATLAETQHRAAEAAAKKAQQGNGQPGDMWGAPAPQAPPQAPAQQFTPPPATPAAPPAPPQQYAPPAAPTAPPVPPQQGGWEGF